MVKVVILNKMVMMVVPVVVEEMTFQVKALPPVKHLHQGKEIQEEDR